MLFCHFRVYAISGALASLRKAFLSFVIYVCLHTVETFQPDRVRYNLLLKTCMKICPRETSYLFNLGQISGTSGEDLNTLYLNGDINSSQTHLCVILIIFILFTLTFTSTIHTETIVAFAMLQC
jgi:hypothetical protein